MWSPVYFVLLVASVRADADADADAEPFLPYVYQQPRFGNSWAALHFGTPQETLVTHSDENAAYRPSFGFLPGVVAPSPSFAIRDVQAPTNSIIQMQKPVETHDVQLLRHPAMLLAPPLFLQTSHIREPDHNKQAPIALPALMAPSSSSFASQHTAQVFFRPATVPSFPPTYPFHLPIAAPSYAIQHSAQIPIFSNAFDQDDDEDDDDEDDVKQVNFILVPHFPTELASLSSLRGVDDDPVIPAGIVQSTQPSFKPMVFRNSKIHPDLLDRVHETRDSVVAGV